MERRLDKTAFSSTTLEKRDEERKQYWWSKTPEERLNALEEIRQQSYPDGKTAPRLQRFFRSLKREER